MPPKKIAMTPLMCIARALMSSGSRPKSETMDWTAMKSAMVILDLPIHRHLKSCVIAAGSVSGVYPASYSENVRAAAMRMGQAMRCPLQMWPMAYPLIPLLFSLIIREITVVR